MPQQLRPIKSEEQILINYLLIKANLNPSDFIIPDEVDDYENAVMGSIGMGLPGAQFAGDIIQVQYFDTDQVPVIISLTKDIEGNLLDLDFWKEDFSKLIKYPSPEEVKPWVNPLLN